MNVPDCIELSLVLVSEAEESDLNRKYLDRQGSTDVIAFPLMDSGELDLLGSKDEEDLLGDVVICTEVARFQAGEVGHEYMDELAYFAVHGFLHLLGYSHDDERDVRDMREKEKELLSLWKSTEVKREQT